ncbi:MFS general substrate transporter [Dendrothele bispora CBS 962.96]|uniref:MFS general substrate transporter n=1 Tax=Dendrothele bispora (strain CBS 962.96) TaxID=1314807 RepID=A0A4S8M3E1_DENBC|nr:MFS general substrate transporter [Dendrothele bispora CBS 962.96]
MACLSFIVVSLNSGGQETSWGSPEIIGLLVAAGISWIGFWVAEKYATMPIAPMKLFVKWEWRNVPLMIVVRTLLFFHNFAMIFYVPIFLQVIGLNEITSSALIIPFLLVAAVSSSTANMVCSKYGHVRTVFLAGLAFLPVGVGLMSTLSETSSIGRIVGYSLIAGFGFGSGTQLTMVIAQVGLPADELTTVTALVGASPSLGGTLGVAVIGSVINNAFRQRLLSSSSIISATAMNTTISLNPNDVVNTLRSFPEGDPARQVVVDAYVSAWQKGCWTLVGVAGLEILLFLFARRVQMDDGSKKESGDRVIEREVEEEEEERVREKETQKEKEKNANYKGKKTNSDVGEIEGIREERRETIGDENGQDDEVVQEERQVTTDDDQDQDQVVTATPVKGRIGAFLDRLLIGLRVKA